MTEVTPDLCYIALPPWISGVFQMSKWQIFYSIEPSCWQQVTPPGAQHSIWKLDRGFTSQYYPGVYDSILRDGDPFQNAWSVCRFNQTSPAGAFELSVR